VEPEPVTLAQGSFVAAVVTLDRLGVLRHVMNNLGEAKRSHLAICQSNATPGVFERNFEQAFTQKADKLTGIDHPDQSHSHRLAPLLSLPELITSGYWRT